MPTIISGTNGVDNIQDGLITPTDLNTSVNPAVQRIQTFPAQASTAGTSIDFTGIPSWAKEITVMFNGVSTNGTSVVQVQLGTSTGFTVSGYVSASAEQAGTVVGTGAITSGIGLDNIGAATYSRSLNLMITNISTNNYIASYSGIQATNRTIYGGGNVTLPATLDRIRITTVNGTDTFDAGSINILVKG